MPIIALLKRQRQEGPWALEAASLDYLIDSKSTRDPISENKMDGS